MRIIALFTALLLITPLTAQIALQNPSMEGEPKQSALIFGWNRWEIKTTPDIMPGPWEVELEPIEGDTYLGLIARSDGSFESIYQRLPNFIAQGSCYSFRMALATAEGYGGFSKIPLQLKIWSAIEYKDSETGEKVREKRELLAESLPIRNTAWVYFTFRLKPKLSFNLLVLEASWNIEKCDQRQCKGNILIDDISELSPCN